MKNSRSVRLTLFLILTHFFLVTSAAGQADTTEILPVPYLNLAENSLIYDVSLDYKEHHISGLLVAKEEGSGYHIVLLSKLGLTVLDFLLTSEKITWLKTFDQLNKPLIKEALREDFNMIYLMPLQNPEKIKFKKRDRVKIKKDIKLEAKLSADHQRVLSAETRGLINFFKTKVIYYYTDDDNIPDEICLTRNNIKMKIYMNLLKK